MCLGASWLDGARRAGAGCGLWHTGGAHRARACIRGTPRDTCVQERLPIPAHLQVWHARTPFSEHSPAMAEGPRLPRPARGAALALVFLIAACTCPPAAMGAQELVVKVSGGASGGEPCRLKQLRFVETADVRTTLQQGAARPAPHLALRLAPTRGQAHRGRRIPPPQQGPRFPSTPPTLPCPSQTAPAVG
jgi:hypothetical protein